MLKLFPWHPFGGFDFIWISDWLIFGEGNKHGTDFVFDDAMHFGAVAILWEGFPKTVYVDT